MASQIGTCLLSYRVVSVLFLTRAYWLDVPKSELDSEIETFEQSPRAHQLRHAAKETMTRREPLLSLFVGSREGRLTLLSAADVLGPRSNFQQPLPLLLQVCQEPVRSRICGLMILLVTVTATLFAGAERGRMLRKILALDALHSHR